MGFYHQKKIGLKPVSIFPSSNSMILTFGISLGYNFEKRQLYLVGG